MARIRGLVTLRLVSDEQTAAALMKRAAAYTKEHFGDKVQFEPFISDAEDGRVIWLNTFDSADTILRWEREMRESGIREQVMGPTLQPLRVELLDPISDPRLEDLLGNTARLRSLLD